MSTPNGLVEVLLRLSPAERAAAAEALLESLGDEDLPAGVEHALAWQVEVDQRIADIDAGHVVMEDGERALAQLRERAALRSARRRA